MGRYLAAEHLIPDRVLVSTSARTRETWAEAAPALPEAPIVFEEAIYHASPEQLLDLVRATGPEIRTLAIVGHNPGFEELMRRLPGYGDRYAMARIREKVPTAARAGVDLDAPDWSGVSFVPGMLDRFVTPKDPVS
jgi:phosphohistidine phosphatase